jgi:hypothetical protein
VARGLLPLQGMTLPDVSRLCRIVSVFLVAGVGAACGEEDGVVCLTVLNPSVAITVVDPRGAPACDARVTYTRDGGPEEVAERYTSECHEWSTELERPGVHVITATSTDGQRSVSGQVKVKTDECGVITENMTLVLPDAAG